jgi:ABC-type multidrug transport system ATPase subunit
MLSIKNLNHTYPNGKQVLKNINLNIAKGLFDLLGPNGLANQL